MTARAMKLYEAADALDVIREWVAEHAEEIIAAGGELPLPLMQLLDQAEGDFETKVIGTGFFARELIVSLEAVTIEAKRLQGSKLHLERAIAGIKAYLLTNLQRADVAKVQRPTLRVRRQNNSRPSVTHELTQERLAELACIPEYSRFITVVPQSYTVNSDEIVAAWKGHDGISKDPLPAGVVVELGQHVRIE